MTRESLARARAVILGEVLFDSFPGGTVTLGGAPFNVAWHLQGLGASPLLVSAVGDDPPGKRVLASMRAWGLDTTGVQVIARQATGRVLVSLRGGEPRFEILPDQAYDHVDVAGLPQWLASGQVALLYHGTLFARGPGNRQLLEAVVATTAAPVFLDVNLRAPWWRLEHALHLARRARWVKLNDEEAVALCPGCSDASPEGQARRLREAFGAEVVFLTLGERGAVLAGPEGEARARAPAVQVVDTVGAGDAFSAVAVYGVLAGWPLPTILDRAVELAGTVCAMPGATAPRPEVYEAVWARWST